MKRLFRAIFFYSMAIYFVSIHIPGFKVTSDWKGLLLTGFTVALVYTFVEPLIKFFLLPINMITLGLLSVVSQVLTFFFYLWLFPDYIRISDWVFKAITLPILGTHINSFTVSSFLTVIVSTIIISLIVSLLSFLL